MASRLSVLALNSLRAGVYKRPVQILARCSSTATPPSKNLHESVQKKQALYQEENETPVYIKGGPVDQVLYRLTMGLCVLSLVLFVKNIYEMANPKKK